MLLPIPVLTLRGNKVKPSVPVAVRPLRGGRA